MYVLAASLILLLGGCAPPPALHPVQYYLNEPVVAPRPKVAPPAPSSATKAEIERRLRDINQTVEETRRQLDKQPGPAQ